MNTIRVSEYHTCKWIPKWKLNTKLLDEYQTSRWTPNYDAWPINNLNIFGSWIPKQKLNITLVLNTKLIERWVTETFTVRKQHNDLRSNSAYSTDSKIYSIFAVAHFRVSWQLEIEKEKRPHHTLAGPPLAWFKCLFVPRLCLFV